MGGVGEEDKELSLSPGRPCVCVKASRLVCVTPSGRDNTGFLIFSFSPWPYQEHSPALGTFLCPPRPSCRRPFPGHPWPFWEHRPSGRTGPALSGLLTWQPRPGPQGNHVSTGPEPGPLACHTDMHTYLHTHPMHVPSHTYTHTHPCALMLNLPLSSPLPLGSSHRLSPVLGLPPAFPQLPQGPCSGLGRQLGTENAQVGLSRRPANPAHMGTGQACGAQGPAPLLC